MGKLTMYLILTYLTMNTSKFEKDLRVYESFYIKVFINGLLS